MFCSSYENLVNLLDGDVPLVLQRVERCTANSSYTSNDLLGGENLEALILFFGDYQVGIVCDGETDEVYISDVFQFAPHLRVDLSQQKPWKAILGMQLFSVWQLTNNHGYDDGLQFEFGIAGQQTRILVDGAASEIRIWEIKPYL
ncbi:DUF6334 family protein [Acaryochloris marina]|uniref:DUF6334 family protein n=1 Tax=Acaryochloris marina TaxID=155978 RepID=UPI001BAF8BC6|nr:DUF6334 family protein [Acaryochloris marina]QUY43409.1 hypothetical protein I1H34_04510 [Acaryochloris marina S15]